jgi:predicted permease
MVAGLVLGIVAGAGAGIAAAVRVARTDPMLLIRLGGRTTGAADRRLVDVLVAAQLSLSLVLLVGATLLIGRFRELSTRHPGYDLDGVATMRVSVDEQLRYRTAEARLRLARTIEERMQAVPGVQAVGITTVNPLCCGDWGAPIEVEGKPLAPGAAPTLIAHSYVTPGYFGAMRIPMVAGTGFDRGDTPGRSMTVVVDQALADMAWPGDNPIGRRIRVARPNQEWRTVVGVVPVTEREAEMRASWYLPYYQEPTGASGEHLHIMVRRGDAVTMEALRNVVRDVDPGLGVYGITTMAALQRDRTAQDRLGAIVSAIFAAFGLILAGFSLYGLLSYSVELRRGELGIRVALGATRGSIVRLVLKQATGRLIIGTVAGITLSFAANQALRGAIAGLGWIPWQTLAGLTLLMAIVAGTAAAVPALRATRVDPIRSLRG